METSLTPFGEKIERTRQLLNAVRGSSIQIGQNLYEIKQELEFGTDWGDTLRDEFDLSEGQASKLISVYKIYVLEGGFSHAQLEGIDTERLYLAKSLEGSIEEKFAKASTLTRRELRETRVEEDGHQHEAVEICKTCGIRM